MLHLPVASACLNNFCKGKAFVLESLYSKNMSNNTCFVFEM